MGGDIHAETEMTGGEPAGLDHIELLQSLSRTDREALQRRCGWRDLAQGEEMLARDSDSDEVLFIVKGRVQIADWSASGREVAYAVVEEGGHVGELSAIDGLPRSASVIALAPCRVASLSRAAFIELVESRPGVAMALLRRLARIIRENDERITELSTIGAMQRVYRELLRLALPDPAHDGGLVIRGLPTQEALAARLGTTRETVARVLAQLARAKITRRHGRTLVVHDEEQLLALADPAGDGIDR